MSFFKILIQLKNLLFKIHQKIRDEKYLIGESLLNNEEIQNEEQEEIHID